MRRNEPRRGRRRRAGNGLTVARAKRWGGDLASIIRRVDEDDFAVLERFDCEQGLIGNGGAVACLDAHTIDLDAALGRHQIAMASCAKLVFGGLARFQRGAEHAGFCPDRQRFGIAGKAAG